MNNPMLPFTLRPFYLLTEDLEGEYVRKIKLYNAFYEALGRFVVLNDGWFEIRLFIAVYCDHIYHEQSIRLSIHDVIEDLIYDYTGDVFPEDAFNRPSSIMSLEKQKNLDILTKKHQALRKARYEAQFNGSIIEERPYDIGDLGPRYTISDLEDRH